jgi:hypothetical protein
MRHFLILMLFGTVSLQLLMAAPAQKPKKVSIAWVVPGIGTDTPEEVEVELNNFPENADIGAVRWDIFVSYDNGPSVFFQSSGGSWISSEGAHSQPPAPAASGLPRPLVKGQKNIFFLYLPTGALSNHVTSIVAAINIPASIGVPFDGKPYPWAPPAKACSTILCPAANKGDSAIYATGLYSPAFNSQAQYTIDAEGVFTLPVNQGRTLRLGGSFNVATDNRPSADPDSYIVSGLLEWYIRPEPWKRIQDVLLQVNLAEFEFDRQSTNKTLVSGPVIEAPILLFPAPGGKKGNLAASIVPYVGLEIGSNLSNAIAAGGSGSVFRGLMGSAFNSTLKTPWKYLSQFGITASYSVRLPATDEVFTNTHYISETGKTVTLPLYSTQARHHLTDELDITLQKPIALTIKHEYGELPPGFRKVDNKISIGLTLMLSHTGLGGAGDSVTRQKW